MKRLLAIVLLLSSLFCSPSSATELTDLGQGLGYLRVPAYAAIEKAVVSNLQGDRPLVLDLRHVIIDEPGAGRLAAALAARNNTTAPLFLLVSPSTPPVLAAALARLPAGTLTLGVRESVPAPAVVVAQTADADRRAYDALETGVPLAALLNGKIAKERFDESTLVQEFTNGNHAAEPPPEPDPTAPKPAGAETPPPLTDRVLQRALQLHRALLAIKPRV